MKEMGRNRNDPCSCGSGKKYKHCCIGKTTDTAAPTKVVANSRAGSAAAIATTIETALAHHQSGRLSQAEDLYRQALQWAPGNADALHLLGCLYFQQGQLDSAVDLIRKAINAAPRVENYHFSLGNALQALGKLDEAIACYRQAIALKPDYAEAYNNLGNVLKLLCRLDEAVDSCRRAILLKPDYADAHSNLGNALEAQGKLEEAIACYRQTLSLKPDFAEGYSNLGNALQAQGKLDEAVENCRRAILLKPDCVEAYNNLGNAYQAQGCLNEAVANFLQALSIKPDSATAYYNLGNALQAQGELDKATACYRQAILIEPDNPKSYCNLGNALKDQGQLSEAVACYRQALLIKPDFHDAYGNRIFTMDMMSSSTGTPILQVERRRWSELYANGLLNSPSFLNPRDPERRLRIGYVSADFREHSAPVVFGAMLTKFDPEVFDVFAYANSSADDEHTRLFQQSVTHWRNIVGLSDAVVADLIRQDGIDILVDLSGFTAGNRLLVFARKPAPVQITAWGYVGGTGMTAMDAFLADPIVVPPEEKSLYVEDVRYLPNFVSAFFPRPFPAIGSLPALSSKGLTFGSFNRLCKVSTEAYRTWTQVLQAIPGSRMILKTGELDNPGSRDRVLGYFTQSGIDPARISLLGKSSWHDHMQAFNQIDISLDPYPHGGGVTTLEGLMMGVPVITLRWPTIYGRLSASILTTLGLSDWIAETPQQYVEIATRKAGDLKALAELRQQLRPRFMDSIMGDTTAYARVVEQEYRKLWREWCLRSGAPTSSTSSITASDHRQEAH